MPPPFTSPRSAVEGVIEAYREGDIDEIARARDFTADSSIFWHGLRLPVSNEQLRESAEAFEISFRRQLEEEGIPDYGDATVSFLAEESPGEGFVIVTLECRAQGYEPATLRIPVMNTSNGWKVVLHPGYDQL